MSTPLRLAAFAAGVAVVFLLAFGVGRAVGPWSPEAGHTPTPTSGPTQGESPQDGHSEGHSEGQAPQDPTGASHDD